MRRVFVLFCICIALSCASESVGTSALAVLGPGVVNNPHNKSLRFDILKFGLDRFCFEMLRRGAPLRMSDTEPVLGRFFADGCQMQVLPSEERQSLVVQYSGKGYGWTNLSGRIGFSAAGLVEYAPDFQLHGGAMYIYFRPRKVDATSFQTLMVESGMASAGMALARVNPDELGRRIVQGQLERGFTVIRYSSRGEMDFGLGIIPKGERPFRPFTVTGSDKVTLANDRTEVHLGQQDFIGGFEVPDSDQALYFTMSLDGAPAADVFAVPRPVAQQMIEQYVRAQGPAPIFAPPLLDEQLTAGNLWRRYLQVPKGLYYLVIDHSAGIGRSMPSAQAGAAKLDYLVQLGEAP